MDHESGAMHIYIYSYLFIGGASMNKCIYLYANTHKYISRSYPAIFQNIPEPLPAVCHPHAPRRGLRPRGMGMTHTHWGHKKCGHSIDHEGGEGSTSLRNSTVFCNRYHSTSGHKVRRGLWPLGV